ncbi:MAG TPA: NADPH-dependent assimilatory sulfite reductase hemoprotein subunit [Candidatus Paceibacterota bacterium]|nr:NADPH-dependent assimilatory sulfite reductase hemoprotein subunit [Verrucomicrobiota bacterium]HSA11449.1 NADPH-dependent assimilatory sulfite reductase hemoprotein subunit [Candidatus Paceibacterota bacterium]
MSESTAILKASPVEVAKASDPTLSGTIAQTLADGQADHFGEDDLVFLKSHGIYQQDDRDLRKTGKKFIFMVRCRIPGGRLTPDQYLTCDRLAARYANDTLRVTSRQGLQFHGVVKGGLRALVKEINGALLGTLAACGDNNRNVMAPPTPACSALGLQVQEHARQVAAALLPKTSAYHSIWIDGQALDLEEPAHKNFVDPLYGKAYLPRKFKVAFVVPPRNDIDIFTNCCGFIAIGNDGGDLAGYNLTAGGGMGRSHGNEQTFPRLADVIGFLPPDKVVDVAGAVLTIHRDFGDRANRKHARLKYVLEDRGVGWFREELERRVKFRLAEPRLFKFEKQGDAFGWNRQADGRLFLGLFVETGRIRDHDGRRLKTALREVVTRYQPEIHLTPANNVVLVNLAETLRTEIDSLFAAHGVQTAPQHQGSILRRASMACVALPTCGLALAEAERYLPGLITRLERSLAETGLSGQEITIRMTGCPNGCARPYVAEVGFVGKAPGRYQIWLGGNEACTRVNRLYRDMVKDPDIVSELRPLFVRYAQERLPEERFGDWVARVLWHEQPTPTL